MEQQFQLLFLTFLRRKRAMRYIDKKFPPQLLIVMALLAAFLLATSPAPAQTVASDRPYEPVILTGKEFPEFSNNVATLGQLFLYKYGGGTWTQIPFQFDEVEPDSLAPANPTYFRRGDGKLDDQDELVFMARDAGDQAPTNAWVNDASALISQRYEIALTDPVSSNRGYVYLFRSTTLSIGPAVKDYVTYIPPSPAGTGRDLIRGQSYEEGHLDNGLNNSLLVPVSENGSSTNFLDRLKLRFQINVGLQLTFTEDNFTLLPPIRFQDGRTRVIRELRERVSLFGTNVDFPILIRYYGYSTALGTSLSLSSLPSTVRVTLLRQSFDFAANVNGAKWYNQNVADAITVTGAAGNLNAAQGAVVVEPNLNWYMMSSSHGSFINIFSLPANLGTTRRFYFHDAASGSNDGTTDSGDDKSYGDSGFLATASEIAKTTYNLLLTSYILGKDQPRTVGETLHNQASRPLAWITQSQRNTVAVQENTPVIPQRFALLQNSPNPLTPAAPATVIRYELPFTGSVAVSLRIFNLLGQNVRELVNAAQPAGRYEVQWDGRLANGERAPAGIYFYQLQARNQIATQKLMVVNR
jgi:hypothetical protein